MQLFGTPLSHFTRKIRILAAELGVPLEFVPTQSVMATTPAAYADNPLMRIPTLVDGETTVIDSDHIARYLVGRFDAEDRCAVRSEDVAALNRLAVTSGIMANEVVLILARRGGLENVESVVYFQKLIAAIDGGLAWLERVVEPDAPGFDYRDIALVCMWQHLGHYKLRPLDAYERIAARVACFAHRPSVAPSTPK
jgi:glutathione S-transferase